MLQGILRACGASLTLDGLFGTQTRDALVNIIPATAKDADGYAFHGNDEEPLMRAYVLAVTPGGTQGPQGPPGPRGATGSTGDPGIPGSTGTRGAPGANGAEGTDGRTGEQGPPGLGGPKGDKGDPGEDSTVSIYLNGEEVT